MEAIRKTTLLTYVYPIPIKVRFDSENEKSKSETHFASNCSVFLSTAKNIFVWVKNIAATGCHYDCIGYRLCNRRAI